MVFGIADMKSVTPDAVYVHPVAYKNNIESTIFWVAERTFPIWFMSKLNLHWHAFGKNKKNIKMSEIKRRIITFGEGAAESHYQTRLGALKQDALSLH